MYTLNNSISSKLPKTASIKFIDIWILFGLTLMFLILILHILMEHLPCGSTIVSIDPTGKENTKKTNPLLTQEGVTYFAHFVLPILEILFTIAYMICSFILDHSDYI